MEEIHAHEEVKLNMPSNDKIEEKIKSRWQDFGLVFVFIIIISNKELGLT